MTKALLLFLGCLSLAASRKTQRILNGRPVGLWEMQHFYPYMVSVVNCGSDRKCSWCSGTLVSPSIVLLAAHCLCKSPGNAGSLYVYFNSNFLQQGRRVPARLRKRKPYKCNPSQLLQTDIDLMTLTLLTPVHDVKPVQLGCSRAPIAVGTPVAMLGYGRDNTGRYGKLQIGFRITEKCRPIYKGSICVDGNNPTVSMTYFGDSGGPLITLQDGVQNQIGVDSGSVTPTFMYGSQRLEDTTLLWSWVAPHCNWILH